MDRNATVDLAASRSFQDIGGFTEEYDAGQQLSQRQHYGAMPIDCRNKQHYTKAERICMSPRELEDYR